MSPSLFSILSVVTVTFATIAHGSTMIPLGACTNFAVEAGSAITFGGVAAYIATGSIGVSPGTSIGGNTVLGTGSFERQSTASIACAADLNIAYLAAQAVKPTVILSLDPNIFIPTADLSGLTLGPGVYSSEGGIVISAATVTLDGKGDSNAQFIFQAALNVITAPATSFILINGAQAANVYWVVGTATTIGQGASFVGTIMAGTAVSFMTDTVLIGRALAHTAVTFAGQATVSLPAALSVSTPTAPAVLSVPAAPYSKLNNLRSRVSVLTAPAPINLGGCKQFAVQAGSEAAFNNAKTVIATGNVGVSPGSSVTGSYQVKDGSVEINSAPTNLCASDRITAYNAAAGAPCPSNHTLNELSNLTLLPGVYCTAGGSMILSNGGVTLDAAGDKNAVWIFQAASSLITAPNTTFSLLNGAVSDNVFWKVGSSATLGYSSTFVGNILAYASISVNRNSVVSGRLLAGAAVTFESNGLVTLPVV